MKIIPLVENTSASPEYKAKHGLSLYIETVHHRLLFDVGPDALFAKNAHKMGVDLKKIDTVILSHGHCDHTGGLETFLTINQEAKIYLRPSATDPHCIKVCGLPFSVGMKPFPVSDRFIFTDELTRIDEELTLFSHVSEEYVLPSSDRKLFRKQNKKWVPDDFDHEQNLLLMENDMTALFCGCSHAGICNIVHTAEQLHGKQIGAVIGGFHLYNPPTGKYESNEYITNTAEALAKTESEYFTCHCTGEKAYRLMKPVLGERLHSLKTGSILEF